MTRRGGCLPPPPQTPHSLQREVGGQGGLGPTAVSMLSATGLILLPVAVSACLPAQRIPASCFCCCQSGSESRTGFSWVFFVFKIRTRRERRDGFVAAAESREVFHLVCTFLFGTGSEGWTWRSRPGLGAAWAPLPLFLGCSVLELSVVRKTDKRPAFPGWSALFVFSSPNQPHQRAPAAGTNSSGC